MVTVLFVCLHNAGRSQMSRALFDRAADGHHRALSAGSTADPDGAVHPEVITVMREIGIDLADVKPVRLTHELAEQANVVVTMGCGDACPHVPGTRYVNWDLADPKGRRSARFAPPATRSLAASRSLSSSSAVPRRDPRLARAKPRNCQSAGRAGTS